MYNEYNDLITPIDLITPKINSIYHNKYFDLTFIVIGKEQDKHSTQHSMKYKVKFLKEGYDSVRLYSEIASLFHIDHTTEL